MRILLLSAMIAMALHAELEWIESYQKGLEAAKRSGKGVMVMLTQEGCPACDYMHEYPLDEDEVIEAVTADFVPVLLDIRAHRLHGLSYIGTPTFHFLFSNGVHITRHDGPAKEEAFMKLLTYASKKLHASTKTTHDRDATK